MEFPLFCNRILALVPVNLHFISQPSKQLFHRRMRSGVNPGRQLRVSPRIFFWKKNWRPFLVITVCQFCVVTPIYFQLKKPYDVFLLITVTFTNFIRVSLPWRVSPHTFLPVRPRLSTILSKFAHNFFRSGVTPLEGVTRGGRPPVPPSDATACVRLPHLCAYILLPNAVTLNYLHIGHRHFMVFPGDVGRLWSDNIGDKHRLIVIVGVGLMYRARVNVTLSLLSLEISTCTMFLSFRAFPLPPLKSSQIIHKVRGKSEPWKSDILLLTITLANLNRFLYFYTILIMKKFYMRL